LIFVYILLVAPHVTHPVLWRLDDLPVVYCRLPYRLAFVTPFSIVGIRMMRVAHFIGLRAADPSQGGQRWPKLCTPA